RKPKHEQHLEEVGFLLFQLHYRKPDARFGNPDQRRKNTLADAEDVFSRPLCVTWIFHNQRRVSRTPSTTPTAAPIPTPVHGLSRTYSSARAAASRVCFASASPVSPRR